MSRFAYVDGLYVRHAEAAISIDDRGLLFADSIYEVWAVRGGELADRDGHLARLQRSLDKLRMRRPCSDQALLMIVAELVRRNRVLDGLVYLQVSRGVAKRDHLFPAASVAPSLFLTARSMDLKAIEARAAKGVRVHLVPEMRWARCDIKTTNLLPNVLAKQDAREHDAYEAWFVDEDGFITEGSSTNAFIIDASGVLRTRPVTDNILAGVTRAHTLALASQLGIPVSETAFTTEELLHAREAFLTSASGFVMPVTQIDDRPIANGHPGEVSLKLRAAYKAV